MPAARNNGVVIIGQLGAQPAEPKPQPSALQHSEAGEVECAAEDLLLRLGLFQRTWACGGFLQFLCSISADCLRPDMLPYLSVSWLCSGQWKGFDNCKDVLCVPQVNDLLNWRLLSQKTRSPKALCLIACGQWLLSDSRCLRRSSRQVGLMSWRCRELPGLAAARGRDGQHGEARDSPGTLDEPTPSDYATAAFLCTAVKPRRVKHVSRKPFDACMLARQRSLCNIL